MQPTPIAELTETDIERAVDALVALMRPKLRALVQRRYGAVAVEMRGNGRPTVKTVETASPQEDIFSVDNAT